MTPRTFWDQNDGLWELHPDGHHLLWVWSVGAGDLVGAGFGWLHFETVTAKWGPLVASC